MKTEAWIRKQLKEIETDIEEYKKSEFRIPATPFKERLPKMKVDSHDLIDAFYHGVLTGRRLTLREVLEEKGKK